MEYNPTTARAPTVFMDASFPTIVTVENETGLSFKDLYGYEYDYDSNAPLPSPPLSELVPVTFVYGLTLLLGVVGNTLVILSISKFRKMRNITNVFLVSLASADLLLVLICVPIKGIAFFSYNWTLGAFLCKCVAYMQNVSMICSVMTLTIMSVERFVAIRYPLRARYICTMRHARLVIILVWIVSFILAIPVIFGMNHSIIVGYARTATWCEKVFSRPVFSQLYELYMLIILFLIPVGVMIGTYSFIAVEVWFVVSRRGSMRSGSACGNGTSTNYSVQASEMSKSTTPFVPDNANRHQKKRTHAEDESTRKQVIIMLIIVVSLFTICWGPILFTNVITAFEHLPQLHLDEMRPIRQAFFLMSYLNSCVNPIVYGFMSRNFRESFYKTLCACCKKRRMTVMSQQSTKSVTFTTAARNSSDEKENGFLSPKRRESELQSSSTGDDEIEMRRF